MVKHDRNIEIGQKMIRNAFTIDGYNKEKHKYCQNSLNSSRLYSNTANTNSKTSLKNKRIQKSNLRNHLELPFGVLKDTINQLKEAKDKESPSKKYSNDLLKGFLNEHTSILVKSQEKLENTPESLLNTFQGTSLYDNGGLTLDKYFQYSRVLHSKPKHNIK